MFWNNSIFFITMEVGFFAFNMRLNSFFIPDERCLYHYTVGEIPHSRDNCSRRSPWDTYGSQNLVAYVTLKYILGNLYLNASSGWAIKINDWCSVVWNRCSWHAELLGLFPFIVYINTGTITCKSICTSAWDIIENKMVGIQDSNSTPVT